VSASRWARKRSETASDIAVGGIELASQKPIIRLRPFFIRLSGKAVRSGAHCTSGSLGSRGAARTRAARKFERKLLHVFGVRLYLAGRTALIRGRMNRRDAGVILGSTPVISLMRSTADFRSRCRLGVSEASCSWRTIRSARVGSLEIGTISACGYSPRMDR
jgi:hypothetical protein